MMPSCQTCKYYLSFGCRFRPSACRVNDPTFGTDGAGCQSYKPKEITSAATAASASL